MQNFSQIGEVPWPTLTQILQSMPLNYGNQLCKLLSGQINKMSDQNEDVKGHMSC